MRDFDGSGSDIPAQIIFEQASQVVKFDEFKLARYKARLNRDFDEFKNTKRYVLENMGYLMNRVIPMEVMSIQSLPTHDCVIVNDLLLYSYTELEEIIKAAKEANKKLGLDEINEFNEDPQPPKGA